MMRRKGASDRYYAPPLIALRRNVLKNLVELLTFSLSPIQVAISRAAHHVRSAHELW